MRTSEERMRELHRRMDALMRKKARRRDALICAGAFSACLTAAVLLALGASRAPVRAQGEPAGGASASIFAGGPAPGYIAVAVLAFLLGAAAAILCFRLRKRRGPGRPRPADGTGAGAMRTEETRDDRAD